MAGLPLMAVAAPMTRAVATLMAPRPREAAPRLMARPLARGSLPSVQAAAPMAPRPGEAAARLMARPLALGSLGRRWPSDQSAKVELRHFNPDRARVR